MKWKVNSEEYETVAQYLAVVQKSQFVAVAAGVVVHQHARVLMADLHRRGDGMGAENVRAGLGCSSWHQSSKLHTRHQQ